MDHLSPEKQNSEIDNSQLSPVENCRGSTLSPISGKKRTPSNFPTTSPREMPRQLNPTTPKSTVQLTEESPQHHQQPLSADQPAQKEVPQQEIHEEEEQKVETDEFKLQSFEGENDTSNSLHPGNIQTNDTRPEEINQENNTFGVHTMPVDPKDSPKKLKTDSSMQSPQNSPQNIPQNQENNTNVAPTTGKKIEKSRLSFSSLDQSILKSDEKSSNNLLSHLENQATFSRTVDLLTSAAKNLESNTFPHEIPRTSQKPSADNKMIEESPERPQKNLLMNEHSIQREDRLLNTIDKQDIPVFGQDCEVNLDFQTGNEAQIGETIHTAVKNPNLMEEERPETQPKYSIDLGDDALLTHNTPLVKHQPLQGGTAELDAISRNLENENEMKDSSEAVPSGNRSLTGKNKTNSVPSKVNTSTSRSGGLASNTSKTQPRFSARDQKPGVSNKMNTSLSKTDTRSVSEKQRAQSISKTPTNPTSRKIGSAVSNNSARPSLMKKRTRDQIAPSVEREEVLNTKVPQDKKTKLTQPPTIKNSLNQTLQAQKTANVKKVETKFQNKPIIGKPKANPGSQESKENVPNQERKLSAKPMSVGSVKTPKLSENGTKKLSTCEICKKELKVTQTRVLGCLHKFHMDCYVQSSKKKHGCPLCNGLIKPASNPTLSTNASVKA